MKLKSLVLAAACVFGAATAMANDVNEAVAVVGMNSAFHAVHTDDLSFTDTFTFDVAGTVLATVSGITIGLMPEQNIDFTAATLNGQALALTSPPGGFVETFYTPAEFTVTGPLVLTVTGKANAANGIYASYAGTLNVAAVPEPETYALMAAGLGVVGFFARRRKN